MSTLHIIYIKKKIKTVIIHVKETGEYSRFDYFIRGLPFHSQGGVRVFLEKKNCTLIFEEKKNCTLIFKKKKNCTMLDRKKCVLHLSGENLLAESICGRYQSESVKDVLSQSNFFR